MQRQLPSFGRIALAALLLATSTLFFAPRGYTMTIAEAMTTIGSPAAAPADLLKAAAELARSDVPDAHGSLRQALSSANFLNRLNTPEEHEGNPNSLRVRRVL